MTFLLLTALVVFLITTPKDESTFGRYASVLGKVFCGLILIITVIVLIALVLS